MQPIRSIDLHLHTTISDGTDTPEELLAAARAAKDWAESDRLRDELAAAGWAVKDSKSGQHLSRI